MFNYAKTLFIYFILFVKAPMHAQEYVPSPYLQYVDEISHSFAEEMKKKFDLIYIGGGGRMPHDVEELEVNFHAYQRATIEEARELEVKAIECLLKKINEHEKIRPFLREYPFKADRANVMIAFRKSDDNRYTDGSVVLVLNSKNRLHYCAAEAKSEKLLDLIDEPYEDARKIVEKDSKARGIYQSGKKL